MSACHTQREDKTACVIITHVLTSKSEAVNDEAGRVFKLGPFLKYPSVEQKHEEQSHQIGSTEY